MSVSETVDFDKNGEVVRFSPFRRLFLALIIILVALLSFGLGKLSEQNGSTISIESGSVLNRSASEAQTSSAVLSVPTGGVYASSKGTKYYYSWCKSTVSEANKVTFVDSKTAESAGYTLASNCKPK